MLKDEFLELRRRIIANDFQKMNDRQQEAIFTTEGPLLLLAGAGSGKTTVLVNRIANLIKYGNAYYSDYCEFEPTQGDVDIMREYLQDSSIDLFDVYDLLSVKPARPWEILAITFTNKAANELKERLSKMLGDAAMDIWASTFHSSCARILRRYGESLGYTNHFTIYDTDDSKRVMKQVQRLLGIDDKMLSHKVILKEISRAKDMMISPSEYLQQAGSDFRLKKIGEAYERYQKQLKSADAMDFSDIPTILRLKQCLQYIAHRLLDNISAVALYLCCSPGKTVLSFSPLVSKLPTVSNSSTEGMQSFRIGSASSSMIPNQKIFLRKMFFARVSR